MSRPAIRERVQRVADIIGRNPAMTSYRALVILTGPTIASRASGLSDGIRHRLNLVGVACGVLVTEFFDGPGALVSGQLADSSGRITRCRLVILRHRVVNETVALKRQSP